MHWRQTFTSAVVVRGGPAGGVAWLSCKEDRSRFVDTPLGIGRLDTLVGACWIVSPLSWSFLRRCSWFDGGLSIDCIGVTPAGGAALRVADACRSEDDVAGGEGIVSMSCFELAPLLKGFRDGRPLFSGDDGLSMLFEPLPGRPRTVPSRLRPPKLLFAGGGPVGRLVIFPKTP